MLHHLRLQGAYLGRGGISEKERVNQGVAEKVFSVEKRVVMGR